MEMVNGIQRNGRKERHGSPGRFQPFDHFAGILKKDCKKEEYDKIIERPLVPPNRREHITELYAVLLQWSKMMNEFFG